MRFCWAFFATFFVTANCKGLIIINDSDPGQCDKTNHGDQVLVLDRNNMEQVLTCSIDNGVYKWTTAGGNNPIGERFSPGFDCSKILDGIPEAKDGLYWIHLGGSDPKQVYCDMTTDGGGYTLIGKKDSSVTWTLPSNDLPVEPYGNPHWASNLGDFPISDFRIQVATAEDFEQTKAHWSFRFNSERPLKELMIDNQGCTAYEPGIGNIAYVKDLETETIVTTSFRCSVFGGYQFHLPGFGWRQMNSCLNKPCKSGYAYWEHPSSGSMQVDNHGAFSFSVSGSHSGVKNDATAFIGCSPTGICCGCFGPDRGTDNYCRPNCTAENGGTVIKNHTYSWFWVRTSLPKRVWNRCMEYKVKNDSGDMVSYRLLDGNTTPEKGQCPKNGALLNDGIVVVPDEKTAKKVPAVPGFLEYRKDTKELYVMANETWREIASKKKILKKTSEMVSSKLKVTERKLHEQNQTINELLKNDIAQLKTEFQRNMSQLVEENTLLEGDVADMKQIINSLNRTLHNLKQPDAQFFESAILFGELNYGTFIKSWIGTNFTAKLCWRASRDGWSSSTFHSNCDNKKPTVTIVKVGQYVFGGYTTASWDGSGYKQASGSFMFSLRNKENLPPFKAPLKSQGTSYAIYAGSGYGPLFGGGHDLYISNNAASNTNSRTNFGHTYQPPSGVSSSSTILAGTRYFSPSEVEVFYLV